mgnify:CR=1 FL=1
MPRPARPIALAQTTEIKTAVARKLQAGAAALAIVMLLGWVSAMDYSDQLAQSEHYSAMVCTGVWPDYRGIEPDCQGYHRARSQGSGKTPAPQQWLAQSH